MLVLINVILCVLVKIMYIFFIIFIVCEIVIEICFLYIKLSILIGFGNYKLYKIGNVYFFFFIFFKLVF